VGPARAKLPEDVQAEYGVGLTEQAKRKILGLNAARLYDIEVPAACRLPEENLDPAAAGSGPTEASA